MTLVKAQLGEIDAANPPREVPDSLVEVQFNPTTLRVQVSNRTAGGQQAGAQARQRPGTGEMQVTFDLVFDTADEAGEAGAPVNVLDKTKMVERFVRPPRGARPGHEAPPRVIFKWGSFVVQGVMEYASIDIDLFDATGVPLRAKVSVAIKGQDPEWEYAAAQPNDSAPGSNGGPQDSGSRLPAGTPGTKGNRQSPERIVQAMPGESLAQLAQRAGFAPDTWRALADGLGNPLKLELGQEIVLPASAPRGAASGAKGQGQDPGKAAARLPLVDARRAGKNGLGSNDGSHNARDVATDPVRKGQAVTTHGGLQRAIAGVIADAHQEGATSRLRDFGFAATATASTADRPWGAGVPLRPRIGSSVSGGRRESARSTSLIGAARATQSAQAHASARSGSRRGCGCNGRKGSR